MVPLLYTPQRARIFVPGSLYFPYGGICPYVIPRVARQHALLAQEVYLLWNSSYPNEIDRYTLLDRAYRGVDLRYCE